MNLYIIRHGESTWNNANRIQGTSDPGLSELGRRQARLLAARLSKIKVDRIYSSPLKRSYQTAGFISDALKIKIIKNEELREIGLGEWEGKTPGQIDRLYGNKYKKWLLSGPTKVDIPGMERISHFRGRIDRVFRSIIDQNMAGGNVAVVTHGGVIASFLARLLKADFDRLVLKLHLPNTCVTLVSIKTDVGARHAWPLLIHIADSLHLSMGGV
jgi:phosphoserine phosphatase